MVINLTDPNTLNILKSILSADHEYKRGYMGLWSNNQRRLSGDYDTDLREEEKVFGRADNRRYRYTNHRRCPVRAVLPFANPKMHFSIARQVRNARDFGAIAASHSRSDRMAAKSTDRLLKSRLAEHGGQDYEQAYRLGLMLKIALPGFMLVEGDRSFRRPALLNETEPQVGDVILKALPAWKVAWEPGLTDVSNMAWAVTEEFMTAHEIARRWPGNDNGRILADEEVYVRNNDDEGSLDDLETGLEYSMIRVHRLWIAKCQAFPNGAQRIIIGKKYVKKTFATQRSQEWKSDDELSGKALEKLGEMFSKKKPSEQAKEESIGTADGRIPLIRFGGMPSSVSSLGRGQMDLIGALQRIINRKFTAYVEVSNTTPDIHYIMSPNMQKDRIHNDVVYITHGQKIAGQGFEVQLRPSMQQWLDEIAWADAMMDRILNQPASARGEIPGTRTSGRTMQLSSEFAAEIENPENLAFNVAMAEVQKRIVLEGRAVWPESFKYRAIGETRETEILAFNKADLASIVDVQVAKEDPFPKDKFNRARAVALLQRDTQMFGDVMADPKARQRMEDLMRIPSTETDQLHEQLQDQMITRHMTALKSDPDVPVEFSCDDQYHIKEESEMLAEAVANGSATDELQRNVAIHIILHQLNTKRKEQWMSVSELTDEMAQELTGQTQLSDLQPEEQLALETLEGMEDPEGAVVSEQEALAGLEMLPEEQAMIDAQI